MNSITRRGFAKLLAGAGTVLAAGATGAALLTQVACSFSSVFNQILTYVGIGLQAFQGVLTLLGPIVPMSGTIAIIVVAIKAGFADLQTIVNQYEAAPVAGKTTLLGKISTVLAELVGQLQHFWTDLQIPDASLSGLAEGLLGLIIAVLKGFQSQLPAPASTPLLTELAILLPQQKTINVQPAKMSSSTFKNNYNALLTKAGKQPVNFHG